MANATWARWLRGKLKKHGVSQRGLAAHLGLNLWTVHHWCKSSQRGVSPAHKAACEAWFRELEETGRVPVRPDSVALAQEMRAGFKRLEDLIKKL